MNHMIAHMVDILFQDVVENEETKALHDELMNNCQEHFQDLLNSGMSEDDAAGAVLESLSGMQEVVDQYPRREPAPEAEAAETAEAPEAGSPDREPEAETRSVWPSAGVTGIRVDAGAFDVEVSGCTEDRITVCCDRMDRLAISRNSDILNVRLIPVSDQIADDVRKAAPEEASGRPLMEMTLNDLVRKARGVLDAVWKNISVRVSENVFQSASVIRISVPESLLPSLEVNTSSGNVTIDKARSPRVTLRSASGDIALDGEIKEAIDRVFASSASGDIRVSSVWAREAEISAISGDLNLDGDYGSINFKSVSGDVDFEGTAVTLNSKSVSGDVSLTLVQAASGSISAEATSGDVEISLPEDCPGVHVTASSTVGEIRNGLEDSGDSAPLKIRTKTVSGDVVIRKG